MFCPGGLQEGLREKQDSAPDKTLDKNPDEFYDCLTAYDSYDLLTDIDRLKR